MVETKKPQFSGAFLKIRGGGGTIVEQIQGAFEDVVGGE